MKSTKKALLLSITSMLLCVAMLIGTTFAWFTDSVTSGTNRIVAGNLDVDMLYKSGNMTEYKTVNGVTNTTDGSTPFFVDKDGGKILWEPGVMVYTYFDVKNLGTLALQYNFALRITEKNAFMTNGVKHSLDEVIKAVVLPGEVAGNQIKSSVEGKEWKSIETFTDADSLQPNGNKKFTVVLYWAPTANDDLYNVKNGQVTTNVGAWENHSANALYINFDIRLTATQLDHENDSFGNTYDKFADLWKLSTVTPDGRWVGVTKGENCILDGTLDPYITVVGADGQPGEIIALTDGLDKSVGNGTITVSGNNVTYTNSGAAQEVVIRTNSFDTHVILTPYVDANDDTKGDHIDFYGNVGEVTGPKDDSGNYTGFVCAFNSVAMKGRFVEVKVEKGHVDTTNADDTPFPVNDESTGEQIGETWPEVCATSTEVKATNNSNNNIHFHAEADTAEQEKTNADAMNEATGDKAKSGKVTWDYRENDEQNEEEVYHHVVNAENKTEENKNKGVWTDSIDYSSDDAAEKTKESLIVPDEPNGTAKSPFRITNGQEWTDVPNHVIDGKMTYFIVEKNITLVDDELLNLQSGMQATIDMNNCSVSANGNYAPVTNWGSLSLKNGKLDTMLVDGYTCVHNHGDMVLNNMEIHSTWSGVYNYNENPDTPAMLEVFDSKIYGNNVAIYNGATDWNDETEEEYECQFGRVVIHSGTFESVGFGNDELGWDAIVSTKPEYVKIIKATLIDGFQTSVFSPKGMLDKGSTVVSACEIDDIYTWYSSEAQKTVFIIEPSNTVECTLQFEGEDAVQYASLINAVEVFKTNSKNAVLKLENDFTAKQFDLFLLPDLSFESSMGNLVLDLNGHTYTETEYSLQNSGYSSFEGIDLTIIDSSEKQTGKYIMTDVSTDFCSIVNGVININSGTVENACSQGSNYCFFVGTNGTLNISGGKIVEDKQNVTNESTRKKTVFKLSGTTATVNITGGTICGQEFALTQEFVDFIQTLVNNSDYKASIEGDAVVIKYQAK